MHSCKKPEEIAEEALDILIPRFSALYELVLAKPEIQMPRWRSRVSDGFFDNIGKAGRIRLNKNACMKRGGCGRIVSHETGHSATWQHNEHYFTIARKHPDYRIYRCLSEGIAMEFERKGLEQLLNAAWLKEAEFVREMEDARRICAHGDKVYTIGYSIVSRLLEKAGMKEIIVSPERYFKDAREIFREELKSSRRGKA